MTPEPQRTEISSIGEFEFIRRIEAITSLRVDDANLHEHLIKGIGDDTAVFKPSAGKLQLLTTDALVEGVHFDLTYTSMRHLGWKSMVASISDIAAMGGVPRYAVVTIALPKKISVEMAEEFYRGVTFACKKYSCLVVGGDTAASLSNMMVSVAMTGEAHEAGVRYRSGARPGDFLCVSGHLGGSLAGLKILQREKKMFAESAAPESFRPNLDPYRDVIEKHMMPVPRLDISKIIAGEVAAHAMIDISDGLASEVHHLCAQSGTGAAVWEHNLPVIGATQQVAGEFSESPTEYALFGGEEYELLFALPDAEFEKLARLSNDVTVIGRITEKEKGVLCVRENGEKQPLLPGGWDHFT